MSFSLGLQRCHCSSQGVSPRDAHWCVLTPLAIWLGEGGIQETLLIGSLLLGLIVELVNSTIETTIDRISTECHKLSRRAKDLFYRDTAALTIPEMDAAMMSVITTRLNHI